jgi:outer membrane biosynthesis protein TonB
MRRNFARWALRLLGLALALGGGAAMLRGWDIVQVERGWSQFIAGAVALSGGAVVLALAEVVSRLDRLLAGGVDVKATSMAQAPVQVAPQPPPAPKAAAAPPPPKEAAAEPPPPPEPKTAPLAEARALPEPITEPPAAKPSISPPPPPPAPLRVRREEAPEPLSRATPPASPPTPPLAQEPHEAQKPHEAEAPHEIERYQAGGLTYVMFSDGSVELRSEAGAQRFSSLEELRAVLATQA